MLIYGAILGCLEPIVRLPENLCVCFQACENEVFYGSVFFQATIAAAITEKSPFFTPMNRKDEANLAKAALAVANSDHLTIYAAYLGYEVV